MCANFQSKRTTLTFSAQICPKMHFGVGISKNLSLDSESPSPRYHVCQFSVKMDNFDFFGLNLGKLPNYMQYFGFNNVEGVAESWMEDEMSWVEVGAWFSNTPALTYSEHYAKQLTVKN